MSKCSKHLPVCSSGALAEKEYRILDMCYRGSVFACRNQCVHLPGRLDLSA